MAGIVKFESRTVALYTWEQMYKQWESEGWDCYAYSEYDSRGIPKFAEIRRTVSAPTTKDGNVKEPAPIKWESTEARPVREFKIDLLNAPLTNQELGNTGRLVESLPSFDDIPADFKDPGNIYRVWQYKWQYEGMEFDAFPQAKPDINRIDAIRTLSAIQSTFKIPGKHKSAVIAYLASIWLSTPEIEYDGR